MVSSKSLTSDKKKTSTAKKATTKKTSTAKKATTKKTSTAKKATTKKTSTAKKATTKKTSTAKKATTKKTSTAKKATTKKTSTAKKATKLQRTKVICISHKEDADGISSAALIRQAFGGDAILVDYPGQMEALQQVVKDEKTKILIHL